MFDLSHRGSEEMTREFVSHNAEYSCSMLVGGFRLKCDTWYLSKLQLFQKRGHKRETRLFIA
jgi:hypothetical protein